MAGLLDWMQTPQGIGLLSAVAGGMAGARRGTPWNNAGRGLVAGLTGYTAAQDQIRKDADDKLMQEYKALQMQQIQRQIEQQKAMREAGQAAAGKAMIPGSHGPLGYNPTDPNAFIGQLAQGNAPEDQEFNRANMEAIAAGNNALAPEPQATFDPNAYQSAMMQELATRGIADEAVKFKPEQTKPIVLGKTLIDPSTGKVIAVDETWKEETAANRAQRIEELQMRLEDQRLSREQNMALRRDLAGQQEALRRDLAGQTSALAGKPPSGYRFKPNGDLEMIPGGPADVKNQQRLEGGGTVDTVIATLRDQYDKLEEGGGITSTKNRAGTNAGAWLSSSALGQTLGSVAGTENQSARDTIAQTRPVLLQAIMKATGMSAKQMDSNAELKLYLATATDPKLGLEANRNALAMIERLYGSGAGNAPIGNGGNNPPNQTKSAAYQEYLDAFKRAKTPEQRRAITERARQKGVVK